MATSHGRNAGLYRSPALAGVADDFTGACDSSGVLAGLGFESYAALGGPPDEAWGAQALLLSAETRLLAPDAARRGSKRAWQVLAGRGFRIGFQKIDSTLRGHPGDEVLGLLEATGASKVAFCPAYPLHGRFVRSGELSVRGQRLDKSEYFRDPLSPAREFRPAKLFAAGLAAEIGTGSVAALRAAIRRARARVLCFDAWETRHMQAIAAACLAEGIRFFAGASGLVGAVGGGLRAGGRPVDGIGRTPAPTLPRLPGRRIALAGSVSASNFEQLARLRASGAGVWRVLGERGARVEKLALSTRPGRAGLKPLSRADALMRRLALAGLAQVGKPSQAAWLLTGGHTAVAFFREAGFAGGWSLGSLLPGLQLMRATGPGAQPALVATKPGGFGNPDTLACFMSMN